MPENPYTKKENQVVRRIVKLNMGVLVEEVTDPDKLDKMEQDGIETEVFEDMSPGQAEFVDQDGNIVMVYEVDEKGVYRRVK